MVMNDVLEQIIRTGQVHRPDNGEPIRLHSSISADKGRFLRDIIVERRARVTLETGCAFGVSSLWICEGLREAGGERHIVIDRYQHERWDGIGFRNLREAGYGDLVELHHAPAHMALPRIEDRGQMIDFAFIDGWHTFDYALVDFFLIDRVLRVGGVVALDDTNFPSLKKLCRYILTNRHYSVHRCFVDRTEPWYDRTERILYHAGHRMERLRRHLKPETAVRVMDLGMLPGSTCIAFRKDAEDDRPADFHREF